MVHYYYESLCTIAGAARSQGSEGHDRPVLATESSATLASPHQFTDRDGDATGGQGLPETVENETGIETGTDGGGHQRSDPLEKKDSGIGDEQPSDGAGLVGNLAKDLYTRPVKKKH